MVRAQVRREQDRQDRDPTDFVASLNVTIEPGLIDDPGSPGFARALGLINKTNQFNITGERWTHEEAAALLANGGRLYAFRVSDVYTNYGVVAVVVERGGEILQLVMSCRVMGLDVERLAIDHVARSCAARSDGNVRGRLIETPHNRPCRDLFERAGFERDHVAGPGRYRLSHALAVAAS